MSVNPDTVARVAELARIRIPDSEISEVHRRLNDILAMVDQLQSADTDGVEPMANPLDATQRLRDDVDSEIDRSADFQAIAPNAEAGLYLVPKVIE